MSTFKVLDVSTSHVKPTDVTPIPPILNQYLVADTEYGYVFWVPEDCDIDEALPEHIKTMFKLAHERECRWINVDSDGDILPELEYFQDDWLE
jgi:hypothetical protein